MLDRGTESDHLTGSLLLAFPGLPDPNFSRTVILISSHREEDGAMGVILNRPTGDSLKEVDPALAADPLGEVPIYEGGPVDPEQILLGAWKWSKEGQVFRLYLGIDPDKARELLAEGESEVRAFRGYTGWGEGQVEQELHANTWVVCPLSRETFGAEDGVALWKTILRKVSPDLGLLTQIPDDPGLN